jgi:hypothetical protein
MQFLLEKSVQLLKGLPGALVLPAKLPAEPRSERKILGLQRKRFPTRTSGSVAFVRKGSRAHTQDTVPLSGKFQSQLAGPRDSRHRQTPSPAKDSGNFEIIA